MTIAEVRRAVESCVRVRKMKAQERAEFDYILAGLIGTHMARAYSSDVKIPELAEVYPSLFEKEAEETKENKQELKDELSALRFKLFAQSYNDRFNKEVAKDK